MNLIRNIGSTIADVIDAIRGEWGSYYLRNGILVVKAGRICLFWGKFNSSTDVIEVPNLPASFPVLFSGDDFSCASISEENSGFLKVPQSAQGKRFVVFGFCLLNN